MRILVIGALGTIGSKLVPALLQEGHDVSITSRDPKKPSPWPEHCCQRYTLDLLVPDTLPAALQEIELVYY
ncbi:SDR family oxidoreductase, partial [Agarivorans sp.]|uniref:SDR family oxidoreductase n=1 Tax=Agarivorans sp. TaxID=1872412 RepID=UPI003D06C54F